MGRAIRIVSLALAIVIAGSAMLLVASRLSSPESVSIATYRHSGSLPVWVARDVGFFAGRGIGVKLVEFSGGALAAHALLTGGVEAATFPSVLALQKVSAGASLRLLHATADLLPGTSQLLARADLNIRSLEDLQDRTVGFEALESACSPCEAFRQAIDRVGVRIVPVAVPDYKIADAFRAGTVEAAVVSQPFNSLAVEDGVAYVVRDPRLGPGGDAAVAAFGSVANGSSDSEWLASAGLWADEAFLKTRPAVARKVSLALADAAAWLRDPGNGQAARDILIRYAGGLGTMEFFHRASAAVLSTTTWRSYPDGYTDWQGLQAQADAYEGMRLLDSPLDVRAVVSTPWFEP